MLIIGLSSQDMALGIDMKNEEEDNVFLDPNGVEFTRRLINVEGLAIDAKWREINGGISALTSLWIQSGRSDTEMRHAASHFFTALRSGELLNAWRRRNLLPVPISYGAL